MVTVEDSGRGIPPDRLVKAFEAFMQLHEDQIRDDTGLGLAVSKHFIALHGGRMWIESEEGRGTTVGFALPVASVAIAEEKSTAPLHPVLRAPLPGTRRTGLFLGAADYLTKPVTREGLTAALARVQRSCEKVLIVDDDPHIVRLLARMIRAANPTVQVLRAFSGSEGLQLAREHCPDVILLDLLMPDMNGYNVLKAIAGDRAFSNASVIIVSARGIEDEGMPLLGGVYLERASGFTTAEMLRMVSAVLTSMSHLKA